MRISGRFCWVEFADVRATHAALECVPCRSVGPAFCRGLRAARLAHRSAVANVRGCALTRRPHRLDGTVTGGHHLRVSQSKSAIHSNGLKKRARALCARQNAGSTPGARSTNACRRCRVRPSARRAACFSCRNVSPWCAARRGADAHATPRRAGGWSGRRRCPRWLSWLRWRARHAARRPADAVRIWRTPARAAVWLPTAAGSRISAGACSMRQLFRNALVSPTDHRRLRSTRRSMARRRSTAPPPRRAATRRTTATRSRARTSRRPSTAPLALTPLQATRSRRLDPPGDARVKHAARALRAVGVHPADARSLPR